MPYIEVLGQTNEVMVVSPCLDLAERKALGWDQASVSSRVSIMVDPTDAEVRQLLDQKTNDGSKTVALFSGIYAFKPVQHWLDISLEYPIERGIITEAPYTYKIPLWLHKVRFLFQGSHYVKDIRYVFAIGPDCVRYYRSRSHRWHVIPFLYCTPNAAPLGEESTGMATEAEGEKECRICFVGSLTDRKNVGTLLRAFALLKRKHREAYNRCRLTLVGDGEERPQLEKMVAEASMQDRVELRGVLPMEEARREIAKHDILVLPSVHDGWGAVVNEALMAGTSVMVSDRCGARSLVDEASRGRVFPHRDAKALMDCLWNDYGFFVDAARAANRRKKIQQWAMEHISPEAVAQRMLNALNRKK